jgi:biopolymer transport protein ExbB
MIALLQPAQDALQDAPAQAAASPNAIALDSMFDMVLNGGPLMIPIALCSIISIAYIVERSIRLREGQLGSKHYGRRILTALEQTGPVNALEACERESNPLGRILGAGLGRFTRPVLEQTKALEDAGAREVKRLNANLKPLVVVALITPLLGLLGTVWGMIEAFSNIALEDGLGKPELLASGISQALITTAAGLTVAIPTQAAYYWLRGRIDRFVHRTEDLVGDMQDLMDRLRAPAIEGGSEA